MTPEERAADILTRLEPHNRLDTHRGRIVTAITDAVDAERAEQRARAVASFPQEDV